MGSRLLPEPAPWSSKIVHATETKMNQFSNDFALMMNLCAPMNEKD